jgi:nanoRNase/pAp phosphatase (c-di-AMP/oligoRNAs hydrolase)
MRTIGAAGLAASGFCRELGLPENRNPYIIVGTGRWRRATIASRRPNLGAAMSEQKYRLVTRSDFDGLVCAVLLEELELIDDILFVHPNDMQQGRVTITDADITTNLPYLPGVHMAFDHHASEVERLGKQVENHIIDPKAPSAARVVYNYYGGKDTFPKISEDLMAAVDRADSAQFTMEEVLRPRGWALLNFIMDPRTGLGRFRGFRVPNYELMMALIEYCREHPVDELLKLPDVKERVDFYFDHQEKFVDQLKRCAVMHEKLAVVDLRYEETIYAGNRFIIYATFPACNISMHVMMGRDQQNVVFAVGKSIFDRSSKTNVGRLMLEYGGGGHHAAGTCQVDHKRAETVKLDLIGRITQDG